MDQEDQVGIPEGFSMIETTWGRVRRGEDHEDHAIYLRALLWLRPRMRKKGVKSPFEKINCLIHCCLDIHILFHVSLELFS